VSLLGKAVPPLPPEYVADCIKRDALYKRLLIMTIICLCMHCCMVIARLHTKILISLVLLNILKLSFLAFIHIFVQNPSDSSSLDVGSLNTVNVSVRHLNCRDNLGQQIMCSTSGGPTSPEYDTPFCRNVLLEVSHLRVEVREGWKMVIKWQNFELHQ